MTRLRTHAPLGLALSVLLGACRFVGATDSNLRELHTAEGMHRRTARVTTHYGYATRLGVGGLLRSVGAKPQDAALSKVEDPLSVCVEALNELAAYDSADAWVRALQIEHFSAVALYDPWRISREIAVAELGRIGASLPAWSAFDDPPDTVYASVEQLVPALRQLVRAANRVVRGAADGSATAAALGGDAQSDGELGELDLAQAADALRAMQLDFQGARRALRVCALLERSRLRTAPQFAAVRALRLSLEQRCIARALRHALADGAPREFERLGTDPGWRKASVQAAAVRACVRVWGEPLLAELLTRASPRDDDPLALVALLDELARCGLPSPPAEASAEQVERMRTAWMRRVWLLASDHPVGSVRVAAMDALGRLSGKGSVSLREEDWLDWAREQGLLEAPAPSASPRADGPVGAGGS